MTIVKADHVIKNFLTEKSINVLVKDMKKIERYDMPPFKEIHHRIIFKVYMKDGTTYEILRESVDKNGDFSIDSAKFITREVRKEDRNGTE